MIHFTIYSRSYCHLCDDLREALSRLVEAVPHEIVLIDVDHDPELLALYDELVPVLFARRAGDDHVNSVGQQLCHYFLDAEKVKAFCNE